MFLVGPNDSGKSNFWDPLRFVADALRTSLDHALRDGGTIKEVRRRSGGHPNHFPLRFDFTLPSGQTGHSAFRVGARPGGAYEVQTEECCIHSDQALHPGDYFHVSSGQVEDASVSPLPATLPDRPEVRRRVTEYLLRIVPGVSDAEARTLGSQETIEFRQTVKGQDHPWRFLAGTMPDGTLRVFGILLAVFQAAAATPGRLPPMLIGL